MPISHSPTEKERIKLELSSADAEAELFLFDGQFQLVSQGIGALSVQVPPGIYKVRVKTGSRSHEEHLIASPGSGTISKRFERLEFASPLPLNDTARSHEFHQSAVAQFAAAAQSHLTIGNGCRLLVFAREWTARYPPDKVPDSYHHPLRGLSLKDADWTVAADLSQHCDFRDAWEPWAASVIDLDPGLYRLCQSPVGCELTVVAIPGWQTQVYLLVEPDYRSGEKQADLREASVVMTQNPSFEPNDPELRLLEIARLALMDRRPVLSSEMKGLLRGKFHNPMLGIIGAHLLLLQSQPRLDLLETVVDNLRGILGAPHPDVEALALKLDITGSDYHFDLPPMLRASWDLVVDATVERPELVPSASLAEQAADRIWGQSAWCLWLSPDDPQGSYEPDDHAYAEDVLRWHLEKQQMEWQQSSPRGPFTFRSRGDRVGNEGFEWRGWEEFKPRIRQLARTLGLPRGKVEHLVRKLAGEKEGYGVRQAGGRWERTIQLETIARQASEATAKGKISGSDLKNLTKGDSEARISALAALQAKPDPQYASWVAQTIRQPGSAVEQHHALLAAEKLLPRLDAATTEPIRQAIVQQREEGAGRYIKAQNDQRWELSERILKTIKEM